MVATMTIEMIAIGRSAIGRTLLGWPTLANQIGVTKRPRVIDDGTAGRRRPAVPFGIDPGP